MYANCCNGNTNMNSGNQINTVPVGINSFGDNVYASSPSLITDIPRINNSENTGMSNGISSYAENVRCSNTNSCLENNNSNSNNSCSCSCNGNNSCACNCNGLNNSCNCKGSNNGYNNANNVTNNSLQENLRNFVGRRVTLEFSICGNCSKKTGILTCVGCDFLTLRGINNNNCLLCDIAGLYFVTVHSC